jgi:Dyp-type peroxidase family
MKKATKASTANSIAAAKGVSSGTKKLLAMTNIDLKEPSLQPMLKNLQGNILVGHGRDHTVHIFFRLTSDAATNRRILKLLASRVTSALEQEQQRDKYRSGVTNLTFRNIYLTAKGYKSLGYSASDIATAFPEPAGPVPIPPQITFKEGMAFHQDSLQDPNIDQWESGYASVSTDQTQRQIIDGMVLLANDDTAVLKADEESVRAVLSSVAEIMVTEYGHAIFNQAKTQNLEHFGYVDGRSQPTFTKSQAENEAKKDGIDVWNPSEPLSLVLVPDTLSSTPESFGSYFVFRKLEQNVRGFKAKEKELAKALGLSDKDEELAGAMVVGRFEDGTPVVQQKDDGLVDPVPNNFRFDTSDPSGSKCPFHAHVRKMSPRGDTLTKGRLPKSNETVERSHRIARRGITYGVRAVEPKDSPALDQLPTRGVGLLFMCFQSNIDNQFGFMQRAWANGTSFARPFFGNENAPETGIDPVIGQPSSSLAANQNWPAPWGSSTTQSFGFESFVTMLGGDFFFAPSVSFLRGS